jgi:3-hydroxyisobutyrate dehydrogenase-like beta-hydroxyacid dehydrogenase
MDDRTVGFLGLGRMGSLMSRRFVAAGYPLVGFDRAGTAERLPQDAQPAESVEDVGSAAGTVFLSLPDGAASAEVCRQLAAMADRQARVVVDLSTIGPQAARDCAAALAAADVRYVDAPVRGGPAGARDGTLSIMVATDETTFDRVRPLLEVIGKNVFRLGDEPGQGQAMKLVNNFLAASNLATVSEATLMGARFGLSLPQMIEVLNVSSGRSLASMEKFPKSVIPGTFDYGFAAALMAKDVRLYLESAAAAGTPDEIGQVVVDLWQRFNVACPGADFTSIYEYLKEDGRSPEKGDAAKQASA